MDIEKLQKYTAKRTKIQIGRSSIKRVTEHMIKAQRKNLITSHDRKVVNKVLRVMEHDLMEEFKKTSLLINDLFITDKL